MGGGWSRHPLRWEPLGYQGWQTAGRILNLVLVPTGSTCSRLWQHPRFMAQKRGNVMKVHCYANNSLNSSSIQWFWKPKMDVDLQPLPKENDRIQWTTNSTWSTLTLQDVQFEDNGFYVCGGQCVNGTDKVLGFATELRVMGVCPCGVGCSYSHLSQGEMPPGEWPRPLSPQGSKAGGGLPGGP